MKNIKLFSLLTAMLLVFASCEEVDEVPEFNNWQARNTQYIDSIADVARSGEGEWKVFLATGLDESKEWDNQYYVYCNVIQAGNGTESPTYTDTVSVNYKGRLLPSKTYPHG